MKLKEITGATYIQRVIQLCLQLCLRVLVLRNTVCATCGHRVGKRWNNGQFE